VQAAVKRAILSLIALDAVLATGLVGWPGLLILVLAPPALWLGRWVYST
jgi:4-hydroxybenzoate polyprenyltransferase